MVSFIETNHYEKKTDFQKIRQITFRACHVFLFFLQRTIAIRYSQDPGAEFDVTSFNYENKCHIMILSGTLLWELAN